MAGTLEQGPIYFFDQPKTKQKWGKKMEPGKYFPDINFVSMNPHEIESFHRNSGCTEEHMERNYALMKDNTAKKDPFSPQTYGPSVFQTSYKNPVGQLSQMPSVLLTEDDLQSTSLDEYKCMAVTILCELEEMLNNYSKFKFIFPQGILNILSYSWKDLTEGAWQNKNSWQELAYKNIKSGRRQGSEASNRLTPTSEYTHSEMAKNIKRKSRKSVGPAGVAKGTENPGTLLNKLNGNKTAVPQKYTSDSPFAISFSLSSELCKERGWIFQHSDYDSKDLEWKEPYVWAVERLRKAKTQIIEQLSKLNESGFDKPVILRHYGDGKKETFPHNIKGWLSKKVSSEVLHEKLQLPMIKQAERAFKKLHYGLIDGSSFIYYPSGHIAICQSYSDPPCGGLYTNIFNDFPDCALPGTFTPSGHGSICSSSSNNTAMIFNQEGGMVTNKDGEILRQWKWPGEGKLDDPVIIKVNKCITVKVAGRFAVGLLYKWQHESVRLSLSPVRGVAVPQLENLGQIFTEVNLPSTSVKGFSNTHGKTEAAAKNPLKKDEIIPRIPEGNINHIKYYNPTRELKVLRRKIKNIVEDWMEYYRIAFEISSPHTYKTLTFPQRAGRQCTMQFVGASLDSHMPQGKENDSRIPMSDNIPPSQSSPSCSLTQDVSSGSSRSPHLLSSIFKTNQPFVSHFNLNRDMPKANGKASSTLQMACPAALRRIMLGDEVKICRCSNHQIPYITDLEYNHIINNQVSSPEQIIVVCVTISLKATDYDLSTDKNLEQLYERKNINRSMPCTQGRLDSFRLLKYSINSADEFTDHCGSLLVKKHNIAPGMFLMYTRGKLLFANYIFNGYSKSVRDLQKQIILTRHNYNRGYHLPADYRLRYYNTLYRHSYDL